jgi:hypothetical protein
VVVVVAVASVAAVAGRGRRECSVVDGEGCREEGGENVQKQDKSIVQIKDNGMQAKHF